MMTATMPPMSWATMNPGADEGAIPAKVLESIRPIVIAGFAKLAELVGDSDACAD